TLAVTGTTAVKSGAQLNISGGTVNAGQLIQDGALTLEGAAKLNTTTTMLAANATSTTVSVGDGNTIWTNSGALYVGGSDTTAFGTGTLGIDSNGRVNVGGQLFIWGNSGTAVNLNDGVLAVIGATTISAGGKLNVSGGDFL